MAGKKKSFRDDNPAMRFINAPGDDMTPEPDSPPVLNTQTVQGTRTDARIRDVPMKMNPLYIETKSRRLNLLVQPSLHDKIKTLANRNGLSVNELIHRTLQEYIDREEM